MIFHRNPSVPQSRGAALPAVSRPPPAARRSWTGAAVGIAAVVSIGAMSFSAGSASAATPRATTTAAAPIALGISGDDTPSDPVGLNAYESVVGSAPADDMIFQDWSEPLYYSSQMSALEGTGITPIITWEPELSQRRDPAQSDCRGRLRRIHNRIGEARCGVEGNGVYSIRTRDESARLIVW